MSANRRDKPFDAAGAKLDAFCKARCRCGNEVWFERKDVNKVQTCAKCDLELQVRITRDQHGREQVIASFPTRVQQKPPAAAPPKKSGATTVRKKMQQVRNIEAPPIIMERPREPSRDGQFVIDMTTEKGRRPPAFEEAQFEKAQFGATDPFEPATFSEREIVQPFTSKRETIPGVMYTTCPCGEPALIKKEDLGGKLTCPGCRRQMFIDAQRDAQTKEIIIRLKPIDTRRKK